MRYIKLAEIDADGLGTTNFVIPIDVKEYTKRISELSDKYTSGVMDLDTFKSRLESVEDDMQYYIATTMREMVTTYGKIPFKYNRHSLSWKTLTNYNINENKENFIIL